MVFISLMASALYSLSTKLLIIFTLFWEPPQLTIKEDYFVIINGCCCYETMALNFAKLDKFEGVDFRRWQKKMHFLLSSMSVVYVLTTPILKDGENATVKQLRKRAKWDNDDYACRGLILNDFKHTLKQQNEELTLVDLDNHLRIEESLGVQDNDKPKGNNVDGPSVINMMEHNTSFRYNDNKGKHKHQDTKADPNKKSKVT
ncbi:hypothetical protein Tco_0417970 [Tanacetum coccineum]